MKMKKMALSIGVVALLLLAGSRAGLAAASCLNDPDCPQGQFCHQYQCRAGSGTACASHDTCPQGEFCLSGKCVTGCRTHCECPQGQFCYYGRCLSDPKMSVYCCSKPGCPPGRWCFKPDGAKDTCAEDPNYLCQNACDCGPAHCCKSGVCVKDTDDPWQPGGTAILGLSCQPGADATYCCADSLCDAGVVAYARVGEAGSFRCFDAAAGVTRDFCAGKPCYFTGDCDPGESCIDVRPSSAAASQPGRSCSAEGGFCKSNAVAEAAYGWPASQIIPACSAGILPGMTCDRGWSPGGAYAVQRVVETAGSCGDGQCQAWETARTCPADCHCGDGACDTTEVGSCATDCGTCGDGTCNGRETPKTCATDCSVACGDGSCAAGEATTCPQDCGCPGSPGYADTPIWCGDGVCQAVGDVPEDAINCARDCTISLAKTASASAVCEGAGVPVTYTYVVTNHRATHSVSGSVSDDVSGGVGSFGPLAPGASATLTKASAVEATTTNTATAAGTFDDPKGTAAYAQARVTVTAHHCDTTAPTIGLACPGTVTLNAAAYASVSVTDSDSGVASQSVPNGSASLETSTVGARTFTVTATDNAGNTGSSWCSYQVVYDFQGAGGFAPPIANPPAVNSARAGQTVPVKWRLPDGRGGWLGALDVVAGVTFQQVQCSDRAALTNEVPPVASGGSGLRYDEAADQFVYNLRTSGSGCYALILALDDGTEHRADFLLR